MTHHPDLRSLSKQKNLIFGMGMTGQSIASYLQEKGIAFNVVDDHPLSGPSQVFSGQWLPPETDLNTFDNIILSPGVPLTHPKLANLAHRDRLTGELELAFPLMRGKIIAVTGSNGKSSTVTMLAQMLMSNGFETYLAGNIGIPLFSHLDQATSNAVWVLEVSSFQLETIRTWHPHIGILLNVTPDHLDRHGTFDHYTDIKCNMFAAQRATDVAICPMHLAERIPGLGRVLAIPHQGLLEHWRGFQPPIELHQQAFTPKHQRQNALFAALAGKELGLTTEAIASGLATFEPLPHRMELIGMKGGVTWINDSKATNPDSTQAALDSMRQSFWLILGGKNKDADFGSLELPLDFLRGVVAYGAAGNEISEALKSRWPELTHHHVPLFSDAVTLAAGHCRQGEALLLSPGCASFDQHRNFGHRGEQFKTLFQQWTQGDRS